MSSNENQDFPSLSYYAVPSYRLTPVIITILVVIIIAALTYMLLFIYLRRKQPCENAPGIPQNVIAGYIDRGVFGISWRRVANADRYIIRIGEFPDFTASQALTQFETSKTQFNAEDFDEGKTYYIRVAASNSCGTSPDSEGITYIFVEV